MNQTQEDIRQELLKLLDEQRKLLELVDDQKAILSFGPQYQQWFTRALKIVEALAPDRFDEFVSYYRVDPKRKQMNAGNYTIQDYVMGYGPVANYRGEFP